MWNCRIIYASKALKEEPMMDLNFENCTFLHPLYRWLFKSFNNFENYFETANIIVSSLRLLHLGIPSMFCFTDYINMHKFKCNINTSHCSTLHIDPYRHDLDWLALGSKWQYALFVVKRILKKKVSNNAWLLCGKAIITFFMKSAMIVLHHFSSVTFFTWS